MSESWAPQKSDPAAFFSAVLREPPPARTDGMAARRGVSAASPERLDAPEPEEGEESLEETLARMCLLYDVPFQYLVPAESFLEPHQIRFFHLDQLWVRTLLDGAMSLGRNITLEYDHDAAFLARVYRRALRARHLVRPALMGKDAGAAGQDAALTRAAAHRAVPRRAGTAGGRDGAPDQPLEELPTATGFLLRSPLVRGWRGLEFKAWIGGAPTPPLRLENLSAEVLLGLYPGIIDRLEILEPPESFHFGFNSGDDGALTKRTRHLQTGRLRQPATGQDPGELEVAVPLKNTGRRVIDVTQLAANLDSALGSESGRAKNEKITSAHLALEMIQPSHLARFTRVRENV